MESWWRVLRGIKPYWFAVTISMICALGVGLSYASGVAVLLPVMKIFVSAEGVHGWAERAAAEKRLDLAFLNFDVTVAQSQHKGEGEPIALVVHTLGSAAPPILRPVEIDHSNVFVSKQIVRVKGFINGKPIESRNWLGSKSNPGMVAILALADPGRPVELDVQGPADQTAASAPATAPTTAPTTASATTIVTTTVTPADLSWYYRLFLHLVQSLPDNKFQSLAWIIGFFIGLCVIGSIFRYWQQFLGMNVANRVVMDIRRRMYDRVVALPTSYFALKGTSDTMSRLTQDTNTLTEGVSMALGKAVQEPIKAVFAFGLAWWIDWRLCLGAVVTLPILGLIIRKFSKRMRRAARGALENWARMLAIINETLIGGRVVKAYSAEGYERRRFARVNKDILREQIKLNHYASLSRPTVETLAVILISIPMLFAAYYVLNGTLDREKFLTLLACFAAMIEPLRKLADVNSKVQQTNAAATRVFEVVDMQPEPNHDHSLPKLPRHARSIEFRNIFFSYPGHDEVVLKGISFRVARGQTVAIVGGNGSGKTTLVNLLPRLYVPTSGQVLIDNVDVAAVSLRSLRKQIGLVTQDTLLFADTIYNNIAYGSRHVHPDQLYAAAKQAYADEFITALDHGYDTRVGEHGVRLSGGQKQRLAIARAILHDPTILILDEAMSQIDSDSEAKISLALRNFARGRTVLMIAHRFQTVRSADLIICLDHGQIVGAGTHGQLLANCETYKKLYENQFRETDGSNIIPVNGDPAHALASDTAPVAGN